MRCPQLVIKIIWVKIIMNPLKSRARLKRTSLAEIIVGAETVKPAHFPSCSTTWY
jgi:hypothetical protein